MKIVGFDDGRVGVVDGADVIDITDSIEIVDGRGVMRSLIERSGNEPPIFHDSSTFPRALISDVTLQAPVPDPSKIFAAPVNYVDHQVEMKQDHQIAALGLFLKAPSSLVGSMAQVHLPYNDRRFDQEGELAVVIGRRARNVPIASALDYVFGYTCCLDITMRGSEDRSTRKSFETFAPMGPWIVTADEFGDPADAQLRSWVSGDLRQEAACADLIWDVPQLVAYASQVTTLLPGDIISTGTPAGVGPIRDGDSIEVDVSGIGGRLSVSVTDQQAISCPTTGGAGY